MSAILVGLRWLILCAIFGFILGGLGVLQEASQPLAQALPIAALVAAFAAGWLAVDSRQGTPGFIGWAATMLGASILTVILALSFSALTDPVSLTTPFVYEPLLLSAGSEYSISEFIVSRLIPEMDEIVTESMAPLSFSWAWLIMGAGLGVMATAGLLIGQTVLLASATWLRLLVVILTCWPDE